jgi:hypothetical protein
MDAVFVVPLLESAVMLTELPICTPLSKKVTLPVAAEANGDVRVAVNVTDVPNVEVPAVEVEFGDDEVTATAGVALLTTCCSVVLDCCIAKLMDAIPIIKSATTERPDLMKLFMQIPCSCHLLCCKA